MMRVCKWCSRLRRLAKSRRGALQWRSANWRVVRYVEPVPGVVGRESAVYEVQRQYGIPWILPMWGYYGRFDTLYLALRFASRMIREHGKW